MSAQARASSRSTPRKRGRALSDLQERMRLRLQGAKFRKLNEAFYTRVSADALSIVSAEPELFEAYHIGFEEQARKWPRNPLDDVLYYLDTQAPLRIADFGCGAARLAASAVKHTVHSFDLVAANERVTACDIANVPLEDSCVDVVVLCLALMGTNYRDFLEEAWRVLRPGGALLIAEVASRFGNHDPTAFATGVQSLGFKTDEAHPFVKRQPRVGRRDEGAESQRGSKRRRLDKKRVNRQSATLQYDAQGEKKQSFFFYFAFQSTKQAGQRGKPKKGKTCQLPPLKPCLYKRR